ncbi:hypothetical protein [Lysinibacter cavernae]|uniref:Uncharacterized protein n=1 Tax=Lysinibacter cavernae TaxID=1640652 RepID=A0A7X5QYF2_9MICO|nr:hypothetical protein [Lysinibacter cavernae]NIH52145.1 hypothetical protein [Lysinibacter cavernae]
MDLDALLSSRLIGGRHAAYIVDKDLLHHPRTRRAWRAILILIAAESVVGVAALVYAFLNRDNPELVTPMVWFRGIVVLAMTLTLLAFAAVGMRGYYWAYSRLRLFSQIFPIVTLIIAAIPSLYPLWMVIEQIVFSVLMIGISDYLRSDHMRDVFPRPPKQPATDPIRTAGDST